MKVGQWGKRLVTMARERVFHVERNRSREEALARLAASDWSLPPGFRFDRGEINER